MTPATLFSDHCVLQSGKKVPVWGKADPGAKLFALVDTQHAYNLQHYREHADEVQLRLVKTLKMPSFSSGALCDVHLCEILPASAGAK